ncbi:hypothetical protein ACLGIH_02350 [Streptomyces sp. HMX87]|uniref:hypothetical protein n=1 Tax=Streptomyces sp. HMX87 TaxID=3390849 RepID=UPI003A870108
MEPEPEPDTEPEPDPAAEPPPPPAGCSLALFGARVTEGSEAGAAFFVGLAVRRGFVSGFAVGPASLAEALGLADGEAGVSAPPAVAPESGVVPWAVAAATWSEDLFPSPPATATVIPTPAVTVTAPSTSAVLRARSPLLGRA